MSMTKQEQLQSAHDETAELRRINREQVKNQYRMIAEIEMLYEQLSLARKDRDGRDKTAKTEFVFEIPEISADNLQAALGLQTGPENDDPDQMHDRVVDATDQILRYGNRAADEVICDALDILVNINDDIANGRHPSLIIEQAKDLRALMKNMINGLNVGIQMANTVPPELKTMMYAANGVAASGIEAEVCGDIARRQQMGIQKYGQTVANNPLELKAWLQHAYEEALDQAIYLKRAIAEIDNNTRNTA